MQSFQQSLEQLFDSGSRRLAELSEHWRRHTNRRTILAITFAGVLATTLYVAAIEPPENFPLNTLVSVPSGTSLSDTADSFKALSVVRSAMALKIIMTITGRERDVHAGDYLFKEPENLFSIAHAISVGAYGLDPVRIRIPEGSTSEDMAKIFSFQLERFNEARFLATARRDEGYLFPDTYFFLPNTNDGQVLSTMRDNFDAQIATIQEEIDAFGKPLKEVVIMASLLEREARNPEDRRKISGVLWNRLKRGMLLQVDAAFLYTSGKGTFDLTVKDLQSDSPYNTYKYKGLPPGPIGSPSLDSLLAAVTPIKSDYLYYLADKNSVTHYSKTYEEHLRKKRLYLGS